MHASHLLAAFVDPYEIFYRQAVLPPRNVIRSATSPIRKRGCSARQAHRASSGSGRRCAEPRSRRRRPGLGKARGSLHIVSMTTPDTLDLFAQRRNSTLNTIHTWLLVAGSLALLAITAWAFGGTAGIVYALVFGGISMWLVRRVSPQMVLSMYKARAVSAAEFPAGIRIVTELSRRAGLAAVPKLYVIPSKLMNAFAVGRRDNSVIAITDALARTLTTRELAGVLAHEISHVAHEDIKVMALADMVSRFTSLMSTVGIISLFLNIGSYAAAAPAAACRGWRWPCCWRRRPSAGCCRWRCRGRASSMPTSAPPC